MRPPWAAESKGNQKGGTKWIFEAQKKLRSENFTSVDQINENSVGCESFKVQCCLLQADIVIIRPGSQKTCHAIDSTWSL